MLRFGLRAAAQTGPGSASPMSTGLVWHKLLARGKQYMSGQADPSAIRLVQMDLRYICARIAVGTKDLLSLQGRTTTLKAGVLRLDKPLEPRTIR